MPINSIEIICLPCPKCEKLEAKIHEMIKNIEAILKTKIVYELKLTRSLKDITVHSLNPSQTPAILINGQVEFAGRVDFILLRRKLEAEVRRG